jgi:hypothetical protein
VRWHDILHFPLDAVDRHQSGIIRVQSQQMSRLPDGHRALQIKNPAPWGARQELPEQFDIDRHGST